MLIILLQKKWLIKSYLVSVHVRTYVHVCTYLCAYPLTRVLVSFTAQCIV
jgi:hypothetical protein